MGRFDYATKLIDSAKECGADAIKFQLFKSSPGNIPLPYEWWPSLASYAKNIDITLYASVWDRAGVELLQDNGCKQIKFAHSQVKNAEKLLEGVVFEKVFMSGDVMTDFSNVRGLIKLYCIPEYPVKYVMDLYGIFPRFDGFSDHTMGYTMAWGAVQLGAKYLEKHFTLDRDDIKCPDHNFALKPNELKKYIREVNEGSTTVTFT
jgi:sialic acid synthase SpsE